MKNKIMVIGICAVLLFVIFNSGCIDFGNLGGQEKEKIKEPIAEAGPDQTVYVGDTVYLNGTGSDPDGTIILYEWDFDGDGTYDWSNTVSGFATHVYNTTGTYVAKLRVTDNDSLTDKDVAVIYVTHGVSVYALSTSTWTDVGTTITSYVISTSPTSGIKISYITWQLYNVSAGIVSAPTGATYTSVAGANMTSSDYLTAGCTIAFTQPTASGYYKVRAIVGGSMIYESAAFITTTSGVYALSTGTWSNATNNFSTSVISTTPTSGIKWGDITWQLYDVGTGVVAGPNFSGKSQTGVALTSTDYLKAGCEITVNMTGYLTLGSCTVRAIVGGSQIYESASFVV